MTREEQIKRKAAGVGILWRDTLVCEGLDRDVAETIASAIQKESIHTAEWADKTMLEKALKFLLDYDANDYLEEIADFGVYELNKEKVKTAFYKAMEQ